MTFKAAYVRQKSGGEILAEWANKQKQWVRTLVHQVLREEKEASDEFVRLSYAQLEIEAELSDGEKPEIHRLRTTSEDATGQSSLLLDSLNSVQRVNRLSENQEIQFNERMTILFGENASGKSGYVRILKQVAGARSSETIIPDINTVTLGPPCARLGYRLGDQKTSFVDWTGEHGLEPLDRISVFDTAAASIHLKRDVEYSYIPRELGLFSFVASSLKKVQSALQGRIQGKERVPATFLDHFRKETNVRGKLLALSHRTDMPALERLGALELGEERRIETLEKTILDLRSGAGRLQLRSFQMDLTIIERSETIANALANFDWGGYPKRLKAYQVAQTAYKVATQKNFEGSTIPGVLSRPWEAFISAGENYIQSIERNDYPADEDVCVYCRQILREDAVELLRSYRDFCKGALKREVEQAEQNLQSIISTVNDLSVESLGETLAARVNALAKGEKVSDLVQTGLGLVEMLQTLRKKTISLEEIPPVTFQLAAVVCQRRLSSIRTDVEESIKTLAAGETERTRLLKEAEQTLEDLRARKMLGQRMGEVRELYEARVWIEKAQRTDKQFSSLSASLTRAAKEASEYLLNTKFETYFSEECEALRSPSVHLEFPGRDQKAKRRKKIRGDHNLTTVFSEGEQKVLALADFIAEARARGAAAPLVLDDPVNSLDYRRLELIVNRLMILSEISQVIVFTHNILFVMSLLARFEKNREECSYYLVEKPEETRVGLVTKGITPRLDSIKSIKSKLNVTISECGKLQGEVLQEKILSCYAQLRSWCELVVEQRLLAGVAQRYEPNVRMGSLGNIKPERLEAAIRVIRGVWEECCRVIEAHSQPIEVLNLVPTLDGLRENWKAAQQAVKEYER